MALLIQLSNRRQLVVDTVIAILIVQQKGNIV